MPAQVSISLPLQPEIVCETCGTDLRCAINRVQTKTGLQCFPCSRGLVQARPVQRGLPL